MYVKSVYAYDGLSEQELTFPSDCYIRLLRKNISDAKLYGEEWFEGAYENRIGYFPAIFVQDFGKLDDLNKTDEVELNRNNGLQKDEDEDNNKTIQEASEPSFQPNETSLRDELAQLNQIASPSTENQQVPS